MRLDDYLSRIGVSRPATPSVEALRRLHTAHLQTFPFENLAIQCHGTIATDVPSIEAKFLQGTGGGYCFEHNTLFAAVLRELGFSVSLVLARVGSPERRIPNHLVLRVNADGSTWLADVGFGGEGPLEPLPLEPGVTLQDGFAYELRRVDGRWSLSMRFGDLEQELYDFGDDSHTETDVEVANDYTSKHADSIFRRTLTIQRVRQEERLILRGTRLVRYRDGIRTETALDPGELRTTARELFGVDLCADALLFETLDDSGR